MLTRRNGLAVISLAVFFIGTVAAQDEALDDPNWVCTWRPKHLP